MVRRALGDAVPVILGYIPMGAAYGILARQGGIGLFPTIFMSVVVFAGASQFIAVGLLVGGATSFEVVLTTFFVNLRHVLMSASLSPYFRKVNRRILPFIAWGVTDETYAISIGRFRSGEADHRYSLALNYTAYLSWLTGSVMGAFAGYLVPSALQSSLEFALYSMFVGLVVLQISNRLHLLVAAAAALMSTLFSTSMGGTWYIITASLAGATLGLVLESVFTQGAQEKAGGRNTNGNI